MSNATIVCEVAVIGGGLAGLTAAHLLQESGRSVHVFEAADRLGGRIDSVRAPETNKYLGDLGPTWVWPLYQPSVSRWMTKLGITPFPQFEEGLAVIDMSPHDSPTRQPLPGQHGMVRLSGGPQSFIDALVASVPVENIHTGFKVEALEKAGDGFLVKSTAPSQGSVKAKSIVVAAPLRVMAQAIDWSGLLENDICAQMSQAPTWMASQAKVTIHYPDAFWRKAGLSGRIASRSGPLMEAHDHSGPAGRPAALFGFVGWPPQQRRKDDLGRAIVEQLVRCFGEEAAGFTDMAIRDWADDPNICSHNDLSEPPAHPQVLDHRFQRGFCDDRLFFAVAETATQSPGLIDGALEAGERAAKLILEQPPS